MSCKVYTGSSSIQPIVWQSVDDPAGAPHGPAVPAHGHLPDAAHDYERRLAQIHHSTESRIAAARDEGFAAGKRSAAGELEPVFKRITSSLESLVRTRPELREQAEADLVKLAIAIARRVLRRELSVDPDALQGIILAALDRLQARDVCRVRLHPGHEAVLRRHLETAGITGVEVVADRSLQPGDLIFEASGGTLDASIDSQLREIERGLGDAIRR